MGGGRGGVGGQATLMTVKCSVTCEALGGLRTDTGGLRRRRGPPPTRAEPASLAACRAGIHPNNRPGAAEWTPYQVTPYQPGRPTRDCLGGRGTEGSLIRKTLGQCSVFRKVRSEL